MSAHADMAAPGDVRKDAQPAGAYDRLVLCPPTLPVTAYGAGKSGTP